MSKKLFKRATARNRVQAVFSKFVYADETARQNDRRTPLYDIYGPAWMKR